MECELIALLAALAVSVGVFARWAVPGQAATAQPFVEAGKPAEAAALVDVDELGMDRTFDGRLPAQVEAAIVAAPEPHAARGKDAEGKCAVVRFNQIDAVAQATAERPLANRPVGWSKM